MSRAQLIALTHPVDRPIAEERARKRVAGEYVRPEVELRIVRARIWRDPLDSIVQ